MFKKPCPIHLLCIPILVTFGCSKKEDVRPFGMGDAAVVQQCSTENFIEISTEYSKRIGLATPRDQVALILADFAADLFRLHQSNLRCQYIETVYYTKKNSLLNLNFPERGARQVFSAKISEAGKVCVNYYDDTMTAADYQLYDDYDWSWESETPYKSTDQRIFDEVCFTYDHK